MIGKHAKNREKNKHNIYIKYKNTECLYGNKNTKKN